MTRPHGAWVYFLRPVGMDGPIKIGCSTCPEARLQSYMPWAPWPLEIAARIDGPRTLEYRFHAAFAHLWTHHEWHRAAPELTAAIDAINAGTFDVNGLPAPKRHSKGATGVRQWTPERRLAFSLKMKLRNKVYRFGIRSPDDVERAAKAIKDLSGDALAEAVSLVEDHLRDPLARGTVYPYPWAQRAFAKFNDPNATHRPTAHGGR